MKNKLSLVLIALLFAFFVQSCKESIVVDEQAEELELKSANTDKKSYIVVLNDAELNAELSNLKGYEKKQAAVKSASSKILKRAGITDGEVEHVYGTVLQGFSVKIPPGQLKKLENDPAVKYIEEDKVVSLAPPPGKGKPTPPDDGGGDGTSTQTTPWGITRVGGAGNGTGKTAWVIDSGIDLDHPDLNVDVSRSVDFTGSRKGADDENGHGTHVAGTIAAIDNNEGVVGVAAGATVVAVKVLDRRGSGSYTDVIAGVDYVAAKGSSGDVANMSLGGPKSDALNDAVISAAIGGVKFALAAGNERTDANTRSPASANHSNIYTVSGCDINDNWYYYSNYGNPPVDICAPGVNIESTWKSGGYNTISGTSMAAPHVAGLLLLGSLHSDGVVSGDPDGNPDPIAHN